MNTEAACSRNIMARWDGSGIEVDAPAGALSTEVLGLLRQHRPALMAKLLPLAGIWLQIGELSEHGELQILFGGRPGEANTANTSVPAGLLQDDGYPPERNYPTQNLVPTSWRCPLGHHEYWLSDYGLKICCRCHPKTHPIATDN